MDRYAFKDPGGTRGPGSKPGIMRLLVRMTGGTGIIGLAWPGSR